MNIPHAISRFLSSAPHVDLRNTPYDPLVAALSETRARLHRSEVDPYTPLDRVADWSLLNLAIRHGLTKNGQLQRDHVDIDVATLRAMLAAKPHAEADDLLLRCIALLRSLAHDTKIAT